MQKLTNNKHIHNENTDSHQNIDLFMICPFSQRATARITCLSQFNYTFDIPFLNHKRKNTKATNNDRQSVLCFFSRCDLIPKSRTQPISNACWPFFIAQLLFLYIYICIYSFQFVETLKLYCILIYDVSICWFVYSY